MHFIPADATQEKNEKSKVVASHPGFCCYSLDTEFVQELTDYVWADRPFIIQSKDPLPCMKKTNLVIPTPLFWERYKANRLSTIGTPLENDLEADDEMEKYFYIFVCEEIRKNGAMKLQAMVRGGMVREKISSQNEKSFDKICKVRLESEKKRTEKKIFNSKKLIQILKRGDTVEQELLPKCIDREMIQELKKTHQGNSVIQMHVPYSVYQIKKASFTFNASDLLLAYQYQSKGGLKDEFLQSIISPKINNDAITKLQARARGNITRQRLVKESLENALFVAKHRFNETSKRTEKFIETHEKKIENEEKNISRIDLELDEVIKKLKVLNVPKKAATKSHCLNPQCKNKNIPQEITSSAPRNYDVDFIKTLEAAIAENGRVEIADSERLPNYLLVHCPGCILAAYKSQREVQPRRDFLISFALGELVKSRLLEKIARQEGSMRKKNK